MAEYHYKFVHGSLTNISGIQTGKFATNKDNQAQQKLDTEEMTWKGLLVEKNFS